MKLTVFQALTILAQKYRHDELNQDTYGQVKSLYLLGVRSPQDELTLQELLQDKALLDDEVTCERAEINADPVRRYFESYLCHETLSESLDTLEIRRLKAHFQSIFNRLNPKQKSDLYRTVYSGKLEETRKLKGVQKEYGEGIRTLKDPSSFLSLAPRKAIASQSHGGRLKERKAKMLLLAQCAQVAVFVSSLEENNANYPLNLYTKKDYVYDAPKRGRVPRTDPISGQTQTVRPHTLGIMRSYMPLSQTDALYSTKPAQCDRPADGSTYMSDGKPHQMPDKLFATKVGPFVNSISGTMLMQLRVTAQLLREHQYVYEAQGSDKQEVEEQLKSYIKLFVSYMLYNAGGHSLDEFMSVLQLPEVQEEFKELPGFEALTLKNLFQTENDSAFERALDKTVDYNSAILQKKALHEELVGMRTRI